jgi:hypothetical protein
MAKKTEKSPQQATEEAVAILSAGPQAPPEDEIREWITTTLKTAEDAERAEKLDTEHRVALESLKAAAKTTLEALAAVRTLEPWVKTEDGKIPFFDVLPVDGVGKLIVNLASLASMGYEDTSWAEEPGEWLVDRRTWMLTVGPLAGHNICLTLPTKKQRRPRLSVRVLALHCQAKFGLILCGIHPSKGTGGNVARLGALLCAVAGIPLVKKESTKAARLACSTDELMAYLLGWATEPLADGTGNKVTRLEPVCPQCVVLPKSESNLSNVIARDTH